ncbi:unnamed protein product [Symbiodinium necroappetens]|uniref:Uncharacterized protein n=1 Tax=Symbiodinium necroappetens TaxID=1628268 RepID=A0A812UBJ0_9DINO|nr:unnamed protein product [Symbiodinium necroappetens]
MARRDSLSEDETAGLQRNTAVHLDFRRRALLELCWDHYTEALVDTYSDRCKVSNKLRTVKQSQRNSYAEDVLEHVSATMDEDKAAKLRSQFAFLKDRLQMDPHRNDVRWILSTGDQYAPPRIYLLQCLCRLTYKTLLAEFQHACRARNMARVFYDLAKTLWYHQTLQFFMPLIPQDSIAPLQRWYSDYSLSQRLLRGVPSPATLETDDDAPGASVPEPATVADPSQLHGSRPQPSQVALPLSSNETLEEIFATRPEEWRYEPASSSAPIPDTPNPARQRIVKRSYLRALRRLQTTGFARMVSWNCGGLSSLAFESLKDWLGGWSCFSSSDGSSTSGVMTMIYLICTEPPTDVLNVYQHSWNPSKQEYINRGEEPVALLLQDAPVQIDYVFLRLPCNVPALRTRILRAAPVVALSGMRHFPITLEEDRLRFEQVAQTLLQDPEIKVNNAFPMDPAQTEELLRAADELKQFEGYMPRVPSTNVPSENASEEADQETKPKYPKASGKGNHGPAQPPRSSQAPSSPKELAANTADKEEDKPSRRSDWPARRGQEQRQNQRRQAPSWWSKDPNYRNENEIRELRHLVQDLTRLVLRQSDSISYMKLDLGFMLFLKTSMRPKLEDGSRTPEWAVVDPLFRVAQAWNKKKQEAPDTLEAPLRNTLMHCLLTTLVERLEDAIANPPHMDRLRYLGLVEANGLVYLRWNPTTKSHERATQEPLPVEAALEGLKLVIRHLPFPRVLLRFHALRRLTQEMQVEVVPFTLELHNRNQEAQLTYQQFERMSHSALWHLVGGTMRMARLGRSPLEQSVEESARRLG